MLFYEDAPDMFFGLTDNQFTIFYPEDVHAPMIGEKVINANTSKTIFYYRLLLTEKQHILLQVTKIYLCLVNSLKLKF